MQRVQWDFAPVRAGTHARIYIMGDFHIGHVGCHKALLRRHVAEIAAQPNAHVCIIGDVIDSIGLVDKRFSLSQLDGEIVASKRDDIISQQVNMAADILGPIAKRIRILLTGNHEKAYCSQSGGTDPLRALAERLNIVDPPPECVLNRPYMAAYTGYARFRWPEALAPKSVNSRPHWWRVDLALHHGSGGGRKPGAKVNRVDERAGWWPTADIVASGHNHSRTFTDKAGIAMADKALVEEQRVQLCFNTGSYMRTYLPDTEGAHYAEQADYPPTVLGCVAADVTLEARYAGRQTIRTVKLEPRSVS